MRLADRAPRKKNQKKLPGALPGDRRRRDREEQGDAGVRAVGRTRRATSNQPTPPLPEIKCERGVIFKQLKLGDEREAL